MALSQNELSYDQKQAVLSNKYYLEFNQLLSTMKGQTIRRKDRDALIEKYANLIVNDMFKGEKQPYALRTTLEPCFFKYGMYIAEENEITSKRTAPTLGNGWFIYIVVMLFFSIFHQRIGFWIITTIIFLIWRANEINKYN